MTLLALDACVCGQTEHLAPCERHCGRAVCDGASRMDANRCASTGKIHAPVSAENARGQLVGAAAISGLSRAHGKPESSPATITHRLLRWYRIHRAAAHLHQLERYYAHCERGGNCSAAELQVEWLRVHDARIALGIAYRSAP